MMISPKSKPMTIRLLGLLLALFLYIIPGSAQDIIHDIARLQALMPNSDLKSSSTKVSPERIDTILTLLAIYGQSELNNGQFSRKPKDILDVYRTNPFIYPLLTRDSIFKHIRTQKISLDSLQRRMPGLRNSARERILQRFTANDVYKDDRMLSVPVLKSEYATPPMQQEELLREQAKSLQGHMGQEPSSLTSKVLVGLVDWIAERAQEEFINTFLSRLQDDLNKKNLQYLFPVTTEYLNQLNVANYRSIVPNAKQVFGQDLRALSLNVSNYLYKSNRLSNSDPAAFNFLLSFRLIDLSQRGIPLDDVLAYARGDLSRRRFEAEQSINLQMGHLASKDTYKQLQTSYESAITQLTNTYDLLKKEERSLVMEYGRLPLKVVKDSFPEYFAKIGILRKELREVQYEKVFSQNSQHLSEAVALLGGSIDYEQLKSEPSAEGFEQSFLEQTPPSDSTNRAMGLSMTRYLLRTEADTVAVLRAIYDYYYNLKKTRREINQLKDKINILPKEGVQSARQLQLQLANQLKANLENENAYWAKQPNVIRHDQESIDYLLNLIERTQAESSNLTLVELENKLVQVKELMTQQVKYLNTKYPSSASGQVVRPVTLEVDPLQNAIDSTAKLFTVLKQCLVAADTTLVAQPLRRTYDNAARFETILEVLSQMLYCLYLPNESTYIKPIELSSLLNNDHSRQLFLGLVYQRIAQLPNLGPIAPAGIASISSRLVQSMADYNYAPDSSATQKLVNKIQFVSQALNAILEAPLLLTNGSNKAQSMQQLIPAFRKVPQVNHELTQLFVLSAQGDYRNAINHVLNLVGLFNAYPSTQKRIQKLSAELAQATQEKGKIESLLASGAKLSSTQQAETIVLAKRINELETTIEKRLDTSRYNRFHNSLFLYGHFIADVASANSNDQVKSAIQNIALPPGSSQNKRQQWTSVELNAYFGGSIAYERILSRDVTNKTRPNNFGLFVPVGLSISRRLSQKSECSMSIFLPIIDLGALTAYRTDPDNHGIERLPDLTFGNVLAPGAHLFFNFGKSPFFVGAGLQYGPNTRKITINQALTKVEAVRYMLTFGIDVPIFSFSRRF